MAESQLDKSDPCGVWAGLGSALRSEGGTWGWVLLLDEWGR
jgi:hypothetical protein